MKIPHIALPIIMAAGLGLIYFLPQVGSTAQSAIRMELARTVPPWTLIPTQPSDLEIKILGDETDFSKADCLCARPGEYLQDGSPTPDHINLSIVLSGSDLNTSIHRPERCLPAQNHKILSSTVIPLKLSNGRTISVRRLKTTQTIPNPDDRSLDKEYNGVTYYFFVGHDRIEYDHLQRTLADMKDRHVRGMDQRWAYVSASMWYGKIPWIEKTVPESEADAKLTGFLTELAERQIDWTQVK